MAPIKHASPSAEVPQLPTKLSDALEQLSEAQETLRAIGAGEVDAFVVSDGGTGERVFTLSTADRPYRMFVENMRDGAATVSSGGLILYVNRRLTEMLACSRETIVGSPLTTFIRDPATGLDELRGPDGLGITREFDLIDGDGKPVPVLIGISPLDVDGDQVTCLTFTDLSAQNAQKLEIARLSQTQAEHLAKLQKAQLDLTLQATHDPLTLLPNRALLIDRIDQALAGTRRSRRCAAVLFVDLDGFKQVNDTHGHAAGDVMLQAVGRKLSAALRPMDTVARIGGDEFAVLAPDVASQFHAVEISIRLIEALSEPLDAMNDGDRIGSSVGVAVSVAGRGTAETLMHEADTAMYQAKARGGGRAEVFDAALGLKVQQQARAQRVLRSALDERRVVVHYQPIVNVPDGSLAGYEALARIAEHDGSLLHPADFIPTAEHSGLVVALDSQILEMACHQARSWNPRNDPAARTTVAVNLSAREFESGDLTTAVRNMLERIDLEPQYLHLELTETATIDLRPELLNQLAALRNLGVQVGLDDFGTGYASLTHLRCMPLTFVKIDRSFVDGLGRGAEDEGIVAAVIDLAANLGLRSIAEGVETAVQLDRLREFGCDQAQGYLFSRPLPPSEVVEVAFPARRSANSG
jgi:diguanylate cyclase (GGDEF)-like protein/PAS domain S-box-containing protein